MGRKEEDAVYQAQLKEVLDKHIAAIKSNRSISVDERMRRIDAEIDWYNRAKKA